FQARPSQDVVQVGRETNPPRLPSRDRALIQISSRGARLFSFARPAKGSSRAAGERQRPSTEKAAWVSRGGALFWRCGGIFWAVKVFCDVFRSSRRSGSTKMALACSQLRL